MLGTAFHHSVIRAPADHAGCPAQAQRIREIHKASGYSDWAYNKWVCVHGGSGDMRGWGRISGANGTQWANLNFWAIVALYDGRDDPLTEAMKGAFLREFHAAPQGGNREARPHSAFFATGCPWDPIRNWIASGLGGGVVVPAPQPAPPPPISIQSGDLGMDAIFHNNIWHFFHARDDGALIEREFDGRGNPIPTRPETVIMPPGWCRIGAGARVKVLDPAPNADPAYGYAVSAVREDGKHVNVAFWDNKKWSLRGWPS